MQLLIKQKNWSMLFLLDLHMNPLFNFLKIFSPYYLKTR